MTSNDNDPASRVGIASSDHEVHGQAALVLVESLIHGLCENSTLSADEAIDIAERAVEVQHEHALDADGCGAPLWRSHALLSAIAASLRVERNGGLPPRPIA